MFHLTTVVSVFFLVVLPSTIHQVRGGKHAQFPRISYEPCRDQEPGKFVKDRFACDKFFYCGSDHVAISVDCPHGMIFNDMEEICDLPSNYMCVPEKSEEVQTTTQTPATTLTTTTPSIRPQTLIATKAFTKPTFPTQVTQTAQTIRPTSSHNPPPRHSRCPAKDSSKLIFLADEDDCHRYYVCYHGQPIQLDCITELHWNPKIERCDFQANAGCSTTELTTVMPPLRTTVSPAAMNCPARGEEVLPHPEQCNYFIYCVNGFATVQQCPFFHHFDIQSKSCMWQTVAKCVVNKQ